MVTEEKAFDFGASTPTYDKLISYGSYSNGSCAPFATPINNRICQVQVNDGSGNTKSLRRNTYDSNGNLLETDELVGGSTFLTKHYTHDPNGALKTVTDVNGTVTTYTNGACNGLFPTATTVTGYLVNMSTSEAWDCNGAVQTSSTDANGKTTSYQHLDPFWRLTQVNYPDGGQTTYGYHPTASPPNATTSRLLDGARSLTTQTNVDGYGRPVQTMSTSDPQGTVYTNTAYDALDRVGRSYNPTRCNPPTANCGESTWGYTSYVYDALGRTTQVTDPDGSIKSTLYPGNCTTVTDETGKARKSCVDGLGRLTTVWEDPAGLNYETDYTYDALANLLTVNQKGGSANSANWRTRTFTYDSLSRLLTASNPENGTVTYAYDSDASCPSPNSLLGNLVKKVDARGNRACMQYDGLNRLTQKNFSDPTPAANYFYDQASYNGLTITNGIGHRTGMTDGAGSEAWSYDPMGRVKTDQRTNVSSPSNITKTTNFVYDLAGDITQATYPTGRVVNYTFDAAGRPSTAADGSNGITYALGACGAGGGACYAPQGAFSTMSMGQSPGFSGLNLTHTYNSRLQPLQFKALSTGGSAMDITYSFVDPISQKNDGVVYSITNNLNGSRSQVFGYDSLNRITSAGTTVTSGQYCWGYQFSYDPWGNLLSQGAWTPNYNGCTESVMGNVTADSYNHISAFAYDTSGNTTGDGTYSYTWNGESQLISGGGVSYTYDGDGHRVSKSNGKLYWYGASHDILAETDASGNTLNDYVFFGGQRVAMLPAGGNPTFYVEDFLGSSRAIVQSNGVPCYDADFTPYGGERAYTNTCAQNYKFEGKERDTETQNDDFSARYYSWRFGRWLSSDWSAVPEPVPYANFTNPQTLNLYSMVYDDPESFADLDGHQCGGSSTGAAGACTGMDSFGAFMAMAGAAMWGYSIAGSYTYTVATIQAQQTAQNQPTSGEGSQANLDRRAAIAKSAEDALTRAQLTQVDPYGPNECSRLVSDSINNAGAKAKFTPNDGPPRPPVAGEWANPKANIPSWRVLGSNEKPARGDVAARSLANPRPGATGDSAIVSRSGKGLTTVHAGEHGILYDSHFIRGNPTGTYRGVVYRRYIGE